MGRTKGPSIESDGATEGGNAGWKKYQTRRTAPCGKLPLLFTDQWVGPEGQQGVRLGVRSAPVSPQVLPQRRVSEGEGRDGGDPEAVKGKK